MAGVDYPVCIQTSDKNDYVDGFVITVNQKTLGLMDEYEDLSEGVYKRISCKVTEIIHKTDNNDLDINSIMV